MDGKISGFKYDEKQEIGIVQIFPKIFIKYEQKSVSIQWKNCRHQLNQISKVNITSNKTYCHPVTSV